MTNRFEEPSSPRTEHNHEHRLGKFERFVATLLVALGLIIGGFMFSQNGILCTAKTGDSQFAFACHGLDEGVENVES